MTNQFERDRVGLKFWIAALAFSTLLLAVTFAMLAYYLAEIKGNTINALARADIVADRLDTIDKEIAAIHHHIVAEKPASAPAAETGTVIQMPAATGGADVAPPLVKDVTPPSAPALPAVQPPAMTAPAKP
jgi:hypothetical protein